MSVKTYQCGTAMRTTANGLAFCSHCDRPHGPNRVCEKCDRLSQPPGIGPKQAGGLS